MGGDHQLHALKIFFFRAIHRLYEMPDHLAHQIGYLRVSVDGGNACSRCRSGSASQASSRISAYSADFVAKCMKSRASEIPAAKATSFWSSSRQSGDVREAGLCGSENCFRRASLVSSDQMASAE